jgi:hypothetical protein
MPMTREALEYQREYRKRTGYAASKKYSESEKGKKTAKRSVAALKKRINSNFDEFVKYTNRSLKAGAKARDLAFNLTTDQIKNILEENTKCSETGRKLTYKQGCPNKASIDRINNRYGYSAKNVQVVCQQVNYARNDMTIEEFEQMCIDVAKNIKKRR